MLFYNPAPRFFTNTGAVLNGGTLTFYEPGTTTLKDTYTDSTKGTANSNPLTLDSSGMPSGDIWLDGSYKVLIKDSSGNTIKTVDNVTTIGQILGVSTKTSNYTVVEADADKWILCDATSGNITLSLPAVADAGSGFRIGVRKVDTSSNTVIIDPNASETINNSATTFTLIRNGDSLELVCDGSQWWTVSQQGNIYDEAGNELLSFTDTASAVNYIDIQNNTTTNAPIISTVGSDSNINLNLDPKGTGTVIINYEDTRTSTIIAPFTVRATTSGTPANFIGTSIQFQAESADESPSTLGSIGMRFEDVTAASEDSSVVFSTRAAGAASAITYTFGSTTTSAIQVTHAASTSRTLTLSDADVDMDNLITHGAVRVYDNSGTSCANNVATKVTLNTETYDVEGWFDATTNYRYTPQIAGKYFVAGSVGFSTLNANGQCSARIYKNGSAEATHVARTEGANVIVSSQVSAIVDMNGSTDYLELYALQDGGGTETTTVDATRTFFTAFKLASN